MVKRFLGPIFPRIEGQEIKERAEIYQQYLDLLEEKRREEDRAFNELLGREPITDFDQIPDNTGASWLDGLREFYAHNHALIEGYPPGCAIATNAQALENLLQSVFGDLLEGEPS